MAHTGYTPIQLYYSTATTNVPLATDLVYGELAINTADGKLFYKDYNTGTVKVLAGSGGSGIVAGSTGQIQFNNAGVFGASSNFFWDNSNVRLGIGTSSPAVSLVVSSTDAIKIPVGTTAQRPTGATGYIRYNSDLVSFEGYSGSAWGSIGGGATGGGSDKIFIENGQTVTTTYAIPSGQNAMSTGPITINSGVTVTVPSGSRWVVL